MLVINGTAGIVPFAKTFGPSGVTASAGFFVKFSSIVQFIGNSSFIFFE
jgi:hypothetical protein